MMTFANYFATDTKTGDQINGTAREDYAFEYVADFINEHIDDRAYMDCGVIWLEPDGEQGDWAVWCNYNDEPITAENADISGNDYSMISKLKELIIG